MQYVDQYSRKRVIHHIQDRTRLIKRPAAGREVAKLEINSHPGPPCLNVLTQLPQLRRGLLWRGVLAHDENVLRADCESDIEDLEEFRGQGTGVKAQDFDVYDFQFRFLKGGEDGCSCGEGPGGGIDPEAYLRLTSAVMRRGWRREKVYHIPPTCCSGVNCLNGCAALDYTGGEGEFVFESCHGVTARF